MPKLPWTACFTFWIFLSPIPSLPYRHRPVQSLRVSCINGLPAFKPSSCNPAFPTCQLDLLIQPCCFPSMTPHHLQIKDTREAATPSVREKCFCSLPFLSPPINTLLTHTVCHCSWPSLFLRCPSHLLYLRSYLSLRILLNNHFFPQAISKLLGIPFLDFHSTLCLIR